MLQHILCDSLKASCGTFDFLGIGQRLGSGLSGDTLLDEICGPVSDSATNILVPHEHVTINKPKLL